MKDETLRGVPVRSRRPKAPTSERAGVGQLLQLGRAQVVRLELALHLLVLRADTAGVKVAVLQDSHDGGDTLPQEAMEARPEGPRTWSGRLRFYFRHHRELLGALSLAAYETVKELMVAALGEKDFRPGMVSVVQTFGERAKFHPRVHALCSRGGWTASGEWMRIGSKGIPIHHP